MHSLPTAVGGATHRLTGHSTIEDGVVRSASDEKNSNDLQAETSIAVGILSEAVHGECFTDTDYFGLLQASPPVIIGERLA